MTSRKRPHITRSYGIVAIGAITALAFACRSERFPLAASGGLPHSGFFIGPQPGPDRPFAQLINPYAGDKQVMVNGRRLFGWYNCAGCHGDHGGGGMGPSLRDSSWRYGGDDASVFASITEGRQYGMPAWGTKVPRDQIWRIVTYIKSMRTPDEPDAPR